MELTVDNAEEFIRYLKDDPYTFLQGRRHNDIVNWALATMIVEYENLQDIYFDIERMWQEEFVISLNGTKQHSLNQYDMYDEPLGSIEERVRTVCYAYMHKTKEQLANLQVR